MGKNFEGLERNYVVSVNSEILPDETDQTFTVNEFIGWVCNALQDWSEEIFTEGIECEMLKPGAKGWQRGKVRLTLEFSPDEPEVGQEESGLDDIRRQINQANQH